jgi:hypothetical protein
LRSRDRNRDSVPGLDRGPRLDATTPVALSSSAMGKLLYRRWLIPKGNQFRPGAAKVADLVTRLRKEKWIADAATLPKLRFAPSSLAAKTGGMAIRTVDKKPGDDARTMHLAQADPQPWELTAEWLDAPEHEDLRLVWPVDLGEDGVLKYPLSLVPGREKGQGWELTVEVHWSSDYVYPVSENIGLIPTVCSCGEDLAFEWDEEEVVPAFTESTGIFATCEACCRTFEPGRGTATLTPPFGAAPSELRGGAAYRFAIALTSRAYAEDPALAFHRDLVALVEDEFGREFFELGSLS